MKALLLRRFRLLVLVAAALGAIVVAASGLGERLDRAIDPLRVAAWLRAPSGHVAVVEMDAASVAAIRRWPWPRDEYARVLDRLRRAGAASVVFDVDFSSAATAPGDRAFAEALGRAEGLVALPTFAQQVSAGDVRSIDTLPLPLFRPHVALASVSMVPDPDGMVRHAPFGTVTDATPRPSLAAFIARRSGLAGSFFPIDFGIDPQRLPRLSFVAVRDGRFDPASVRGRDVLIGATAIEMGDRYATPHWGVIPGVIVQALAAETLLRGVPAEASPIVPVLLALLIGALLLRLRRIEVAAAAMPVGFALLFAAVVAMQVAAQTVYPLASALAALAIVAIGRFACHYLERIDRERCFDEDTGLPNRQAMVRDLAHAAAAPVLVAQIGNMDALGTLLGERAGHDLVLRIAERLRLAAGGTVYRIGDRALALLLPVGAAEDAETVAALRAVLTQPVEILGRRTDAAVHLGISDADGGLADRLINAARAAEDAVASGAFYRHSSVDAEALERRLVLMGELDEAIAAGEIEVHYQPKLSLATDRIASVEALVRWRHPTRGMVRPDLFIPLAEQSDRIAPLTLFVLAQVLRDLADWRARGFDLSAAVNLSALLIAEPGFNAAVGEMLAGAPVPPDRLIFEVTESATLADPARAGAHLRAFRDRGVAISMDDYGTGQSTLTYLRQLPLSELKIDRSFVQHVHVNRSDELMVRSTIDLAHNLGLKVVAEGIEEPGCLALLRDAGCDMAQGYLISRPLTAAQLIAALSDRSLAA